MLPGGNRRLQWAPMRYGMRNVALTALLLAMATTADAQSVKAGIEAWQSADYDSAVKIWRPLAEAGDADAAFNLGQLTARTRSPDARRRQNWLEVRRAGQPRCSTTLGLLLLPEATGRRAALDKTAPKRRARALLIIARRVNGDGVVRDTVLAYAYVSRAGSRRAWSGKSLWPDDKRYRASRARRSRGETSPPGQTERQAEQRRRQKTRTGGAAKSRKKLPARRSGQAQATEA